MVVPSRRYTDFLLVLELSSLSEYQCYRLSCYGLVLFWQPSNGHMLALQTQSPFFWQFCDCIRNIIVEHIKRGFILCQEFVYLM